MPMPPVVSAWAHLRQRLRVENLLLGPHPRRDTVHAILKILQGADAVRAG